MQNIFLIFAIKTDDLKTRKKACLAPIINQMITLEVNGLEINLSDGQKYNPHFIPVLILGDNLNSLMGCNTTFNWTFCRFCSISKTLSETSPTDLLLLRRTKDNYNEQLDQENPKETGIVQKCFFNRIRSFNVIDNLSVDAMHDFLEGICHYDMCKSILYFINEKKYFTFEI